jgi:Zn-dependent peptidase ImmA (M78 family)/DNA-binding XRE family transcriptional regulator
MASARAHINPNMLAWARKRVNATPEQIARRVGTSLDVVQRWEAGERRPTIKQLRTVAKYLERPVSHFYLDEPPEEPTPRIEMRRVFDGDPVSDSFDFAREVQRLVRRRQIALDLFERLGEDPPSLPEPRDLQEAPEEVGTFLRFNLLGIDVDEQVGWQGRYEALRAWREALEQIGILSFQLSGIDIAEARGCAIAHRPLPVVAFNSSDSVRGRVFTIFHEVAHVLLGTSTLHSRSPFESDDETEQWCNRVAAAALIPKDDLLSHYQVQAQGTNAMWTETEIETLAGRYGVSPAALIRRLDTFDRIADTPFHALREEFDGRRRSEALAEDGGGDGGGNFYNTALTQLGSLLPRLAFQGFYANAIGASELSDIMGTKVKNLGSFEQKVMGTRTAFVEQ